MTLSGETNTCAREGCTNPAKRKWCSDSCRRRAAWERDKADPEKMDKLRLIGRVKMRQKQRDPEWVTEHNRKRRLRYATDAAYRAERRRRNNAKERARTQAARKARMAREFRHAKPLDEALVLVVRIAALIEQAPRRNPTERYGLAAAYERVRGVEDALRHAAGHAYDPTIEQFQARGRRAG